MRFFVYGRLASFSSVGQVAYNASIESVNNSSSPELVKRALSSLSSEYAFTNTPNDKAKVNLGNSGVGALLVCCSV